MPPASTEAQRTKYSQLFLYPLLIVAIAALGVSFFKAATEDGRTPEELLADIQAAGAHRRDQDAHTLAHMARDTAEKGDRFSEEVTRRLLALIESVAKEDERDADLLTVLTLAAGRAGTPELVVPVMSALALDAASPPSVRFQAVWALGLSGVSGGAEETLRRVLETERDAEGWEFRWNALAGLSNLKSSAAVPFLEEALEDPRRELRWSAACWLASRYSNPKGIGVLRNLLDWEHLDAERGDRGLPLDIRQKEEYMLMALKGLFALEGPALRGVLEEKTRDARSARVRNQAFELLAQCTSPGGSGGAE
jgi:HEAT repeat protein